MNKNWLACILTIVGLAVPARAALVFTNVTGISTPANIPTLNAVAYDGNNTFVAVGENSTTLSATFGSSLPWVSNAVPTSALSLKSVAAGNNRFVAGGPNAVVFSSTNATSWVQPANKPFGLAVNVQGLAFNPNDSRFAAVSSFVNISYADSALATWVAATITNSVLIESFRGLTTLPGSGFAACGLRGDIRLSFDGGATWNESRPFTASEPDLFGIAAGGGQQLMSVGSAGRVMVSTDSGANWSVNAAPIGSTNNAVAFTGDGFIVVGDGGRILTGNDANASNWTTNAVFNASGNLRGVAYATTGKMQGVAVIVGDGGTVILGGTLPPKPHNPVPAANCSFLPVNNALSVSVTNSELLTVDWFAAAAGGSPLAGGVDTANFVAPDQLPGTYTYFAQTRDRRTGFVSVERQPVTLTLFPRPTGNVSGTTMICFGDSTTIQVALTGQGPWNVTWFDETTQTVYTNFTNVGGNGTSGTNTLTVSPVVTTTYRVTALSDANNCDFSFPSNLTGVATVTLDTIPPVVNTKNIAVSLSPTAPGTVTVLAAQVDGDSPNNSTDNCAIAQRLISKDGGATFVASVTFGCSETGVRPVLLKVIDTNGNAATNGATVTVQDVTLPIITCPANIAVVNALGQCGSNVTFTVTATDNCAVSGIVSTPPSGFAFPVGITTVTNVATDIHGNTSSCTFTVTVTDTEKPSISCPANIAVVNALGQCGSNVTFTVTATDNCAVSGIVSTPPSGFAFPVGITTVTNVATDIHGNTSSCTFTVTVTDTEKPSISCPANIAVVNALGQCGSNVTFTVTATDNCAVSGIVSTPPSGFAFPVGITTVTNVATDIHGNTSSCTFTVTVTDTEKPTISCPANIAVVNALGQCGSNVTFTVTATDNCAVSGIVSTPPSGFAFPVGITTVTNVATDIHGNTNVCTFTVTVTDTELPTITAPLAVTATNDVGLCYATGVVLGVPLATNDNCGILIATNDAPAQFDLGTNLVTWTAWDIHGNSATATQTITVVAATPCALLTITRPDATNVVVEWYGLWTLESATNLTAALPWTFLTNGVAGVTNRWTNSVIPPADTTFFRLVLTNAP